MKKLLFIMCLACALDVKAKLRLEFYKPEAQYFPQSMNLVHGYLLDREGILPGQRFGVAVTRVDRDPVTDEYRYGARDESRDPTTGVAITLFPSPYTAKGAEVTLSTTATGSLTSCFEGTPNMLERFIAWMFRVANRARANTRESYHPSRLFIQNKMC
ncbi:hypothetical protein FACS189449_13390 [Alphaproteobacteria bacterium]|nr:hypothetical protein FACS189449_13390 [Alphaproteobacteria bacterium]